MMRNVSPRRTLRSAWIAAALLASVMTARADAQACAGDCNGSGNVSINELITGVNIALGSASIDACRAFDTTGDGRVSINELIAAVNRALNGCGAGGTPTPTVSQLPTTPTPTRTVNNSTPTATPPVSGSCGNGDVDFGQGETCDDSNTVEGVGDSCPANCRIAACGVSGTTVTADIVFDADPTDLLITGLTLFIRYPDGTVDVPGVNNDPAVQAAVTSDFFSITPNDTNFSLTTVLIDPFLTGIEPGTAGSIEFIVCEGAEPPAGGAFRCEVTDATDADGGVVTDQVTCSIVPR